MAKKKPEIRVEKAIEEVTLTVSIRSLFPARLRYSGRVSGKQYEWEKSGDVVEVQTEDAPDLLLKKIGSKGCCGVQSNGNVLFEQI